MRSAMLVFESVQGLAPEIFCDLLRKQNLLNAARKRAKTWPNLYILWSSQNTGLMLISVLSATRVPNLKAL